MTNPRSLSTVDAVLLRDGGMCGMLGSDGCPGSPADVANHRLNRGMGGGGDSSLANLIAVETVCNGLLEGDAEFRAEGLRRGVKLLPGDDPELVPAWSPFFGQWVFLGESLRLSGVRDATRSARAGWE
jgi:hypothetical protein